MKSKQRLVGRAKPRQFVLPGMELLAKGLRFRKKIWQFNTYETAGGEFLALLPDGQKNKSFLDPSNWDFGERHYLHGSERLVFWIESKLSNGETKKLVFKPIIPEGRKGYRKDRAVTYARKEARALHHIYTSSKIVPEKPYGIYFNRRGQKFLITEFVEGKKDFWSAENDLKEIAAQLAKIGFNPQSLYDLKASHLIYDEKGTPRLVDVQGFELKNIKSLR